MTTTRPDVDKGSARSIQTAKRRLATVRDQLAKAKDKADELRAERDEIVGQLRDAGIYRDEIAELAGISVDMVKLILSKRTNGSD